MKRDRNGKLVFENLEEEINYNRKKEAFLSRTDEQNAAIFSLAICQEINNYVKDGKQSVC